MNFQAPVGGTISPVNNQFYEGGQFIPDTGLFCGIKKKAKKFARIDRVWSDLFVRQAYRPSNGYFVVAMYVGSKQEKYLNSHPIKAFDEAKVFAEEVLKLRGKEYLKQGFVPHPTRLVVEK